MNKTEQQTSRQPSANTTALSSPTSTSPTLNLETVRQQKLVRKAIKKATFCTLATTSPAGCPHVAGVVYEMVDGTLWIHALRTSRKARSIAANGAAAVCIPFRRLPVGPPYTVHFQALAAIVAMDDPEVLKLLEAGKLQLISSHGALAMEDGCFLRVRPTGMVHSFGPGAKVIDLARDPLGSGARSVHLDDLSVEVAKS